MRGGKDLLGRMTDGKVPVEIVSKLGKAVSVTVLRGAAGNEMLVNGKYALLK